MSRRIAAVVFAVAMIAGGIAIRNSRSGDAPRRELAEDANLYSVFDDDDGSILCAPELAALCETLAGIVGPIRTEPTWTTADRLAGGGALGADAWLAFRPLDEMAVPPTSPSTLAPAAPVARSPIVLAGSPAVIGAIEAACRDPRVLLSCAGNLAGVKLMLRDPATSVVGAIALDVLAGELGVAAPGVVADEGAATLRSLLGRSRLTPVPYEDVSRLPEGSVALTLEADVNLFLMKLPFEQRRSYSGVAVLYPFEARAAEVVVMPARSFRRADDLVAVINSTRYGVAADRAGFDVPGHSRDLVPTRVFAKRPTIRSDLPPPAPARLRQLRALPRTAAGSATSP